MGSLPQAIGSLSQLMSERLLRLIRSRKKLVLAGVFLQALMHIPVILVILFREHKIPFLIGFVVLYWIFGMVIGPAWSSWMGDLVSEKRRGNYFGNRNKIAGIVSFITFVIAGLILQRFADAELQYLGFAVIFTLAMSSRLSSFFFLAKKYEPPYNPLGGRLRMRDFAKNLGSSNFGILTLFMCLMNFAVFVSAHFFAPYMLYGLEFSYLQYTIVIASALIIKFLFIPIWGVASDKFGAKKVIATSGFLMPFVPLLWIFSYNLYYLVAIQIFSGFAWAGFEIASLRFLFDASKPETRSASIAYFNAFGGMAMLTGSITGGYIIRHNKLFWSPYLLVFLLSFALRLAVSIYFIPRLKEERKVKRIGYKDLLLNILTTVPTFGFVYGLITFNMNRKS